MMKKHSVTISGHATSISLEDEFWNEIKIIAKAQGVSLSALIQNIDNERDEDQNLSSALRVFVLQSIKAENSIN